MMALVGFLSPLLSVSAQSIDLLITSRIIYSDLPAARHLTMLTPLPMRYTFHHPVSLLYCSQNSPCNLCLEKALFDTGWHTQHISDWIRMIQTSHFSALKCHFLEDSKGTIWKSSGFVEELVLLTGLPDWQHGFSIWPHRWDNCPNAMSCHPRFCS